MLHRNPSEETKNLTFSVHLPDKTEPGDNEPTGPRVDLPRLQNPINPDEEALRNESY